MDACNDESDIVENMRRDWDARARENAKFYVNCQKWDQDDDQFHSSAPDVLVRVRRDYPRLPSGSPRGLRCLEIGCGIGRLMYSLALDWGEIHGVDVSGEMLRLGRERLSALPNAFFHQSFGSKMPYFEDESLDLVYSFAVFQHIPDRDIVLGYLKEAFRLLKRGGILIAQFNSAPPAEDRCDTWVGMWIAEEDLLARMKEQGWHVLSSEGAKTQYMWITARKPEVKTNQGNVHANVRIESVAGTSQSSEIMAGGPDGFATMVTSGLTDDLSSITGLSVVVGQSPVEIRYIGPKQPDGLRQVNLQVPQTTNLGRQPLTIYWEDSPLGEPYWISVQASPLLHPNLIGITDGVELTVRDEVRHGRMQITIEGCANVETFRAITGDYAFQILGTFCEDPLRQRYKINLLVPPPPNSTGDTPFAFGWMASNWARTT